MYTPHTSVLYVRICRCSIWRYVHKITLFPLATDLFSNVTFPSTYCEDDHRQAILIYLCVLSCIEHKQRMYIMTECTTVQERFALPGCVRLRHMSGPVQSVRQAGLQTPLTRAQYSGTAQQSGPVQTPLTRAQYDGR